VPKFTKTSIIKRKNQWKETLVEMSKQGKCIHENLVLERPLAPGTGIARFAGKGDCKSGKWLGTAKGCCPLAMKGGGAETCNAWLGTIPAF
jgi:hypothetical protein